MNSKTRLLVRRGKSRSEIDLDSQAQVTDALVNLGVPVPAWKILMAFWIRDNLPLNVLMILYPLETIRLWQLTG